MLKMIELLSTIEVASIVVADDDIAGIMIESASVSTTDEEVGLWPSSPPNNTAIYS